MAGKSAAESGGITGLDPAGEHGGPAARLESLQADLEEQARRLRHDLAGPTRTVSGFARLIEERLGDDLDPEARRYLGLMAKAASEVETLAAGNLELARVAARPPELSSCEPSRVAAGAWDAIGDGSEAGRPALEIDEMPGCTADPEMLLALYAQLLDNAVKFSDPHREQRIHVGATEGPHGTVYWVADQGTGFEERLAPQAFEPFRKLSVDDHPGAGVGLAIVDRIARAHGGSAWAEAAPGVGAKISFTLGPGGAEAATA